MTSDLKPQRAHGFARDHLTAVSLGLSLGITVTAEGVETEIDLACLKKEDCDEGQRFLFSKERPPGGTMELPQGQREWDAA